MSSLRAPDLVASPAERACLDALRAAVGVADGPMERHCVRIFVVAERLGADAGRSLDREALLCAALLHDAGLYDTVASSDSYTRDGRRLAERVLAPFDWPPGRRALCLDAIEHHHALGEMWKLGAEVECLRLADRVDVSAGLVRHGVPGGWYRGLLRAVPRAGFDAMLMREVGKMALRRPASLPGIFR